MRIPAAIFFIFTLPIVIFIATALYGTTTSSDIKQELAKANIYEKLLNQFNDPLTQSEIQSADPAFSMVFTLIREELTPAYFRKKVELFIDDTTTWMLDQTTVPPVISFNEIKEQIYTKNPQLLTDMQKSIGELKQQAIAYQEFNSTEQLESFDNQTQNLNSLMESDFTIPLGKNLTPLKNTYKWLKIAFPAICLLLLLSLFLVVTFSRTTTAKLRWVAAVFALSALYGLLIIAANTTLLTTFEKFLLNYDNKLLSLLAPLITKLLAIFANQYKSYQLLINKTFLAIAAVCLIASFIHKPQPADPDKKAVRKSLKKIGI